MPTEPRTYAAGIAEGLRRAAGKANERYCKLASLDDAQEDRVVAGALWALDALRDWAREEARRVAREGKK